jgi:hypothetical protein
MVFTVPGSETAVQINITSGSGGTTTKAHMWYQGPVSPAGSTQLGDLNDLSAAGDWAMIAVSVKPSAPAALRARPVIARQAVGRAAAI